MNGFGTVSMEELVADVAAYGRMPAAEAEQTLRQVLRSIGRACGSGACSELMQMLPPSLAAEVMGGGRASAGAGDPGAAPGMSSGMVHGVPSGPGVVGGLAGADFSLAAGGSPGDSLIDRQIFIGPMVQSYDTEYGYDQTLGGMDLVSVYMDDDAARRTQAAFAALRRRLSPAAVETMAQVLPPEIADWWRTA